MCGYKLNRSVSVRAASELLGTLLRRCSNWRRRNIKNGERGVPVVGQLDWVGTLRNVIFSGEKKRTPGRAGSIVVPPRKCDCWTSQGGRISLE